METVITLYFPAELQLDYEKINRMCGLFFFFTRLKLNELKLVKNEFILQETDVTVCIRGNIKFVLNLSTLFIKS